MWELVDLLNGVRGVLQLNVPSFNLATFWYVYTFYAPLALVSHLMIFWILIKSRSGKNKVSDSVGDSFIGPCNRNREVSTGREIGKLLANCLTLAL